MQALCGLLVGSHCFTAVITLKIPLSCTAVDPTAFQQSSRGFELGSFVSFSESLWTLAVYRDKSVEVARSHIL